MAAGIACQAFASPAEIAIFSNYRQDSGSLALCSTLSDGASMGYGKLRLRQVHIWQIGVAAAFGFADNFSVMVLADWGQVLGGQLRDSGVSDIVSDPWNAISGSYGNCCLCSCEVDSCYCGIQQKSQSMVPVKAALGGNVWDILLGVDYSFGLTEHTALAPMIGLAFNHQRSKLKNSTWGPIRAEITPVSCFVKSPFDLSFQPVQDSDNLLVKVKGGDQAERYLWLDAITYAQQVAGSFFPVIPLTELENVSCNEFGSCFDGSVYKAGWNGAFVGLGLQHDFDEQLSFNIGYKFYLQSYQGSYTTFGGRSASGCVCSNCPTFVVNDSTFRADPASAVVRQGFATDTIKMSGLAYGQELAAAANFQCNEYQFSLFASAGYRLLPGCKNVSPCSSCNTIVNGGLVIDGNTERPIWSGATVRNVRWNSFNIGVSASYLF